MAGFIGRTLVAAAILLFAAPALRALDAGMIEHELDNGLRVVILPMAGSSRVSCRVVYNVGSAHDAIGQTGMAHFLEHMMFKGTDVLRTTDWDRERPELDKLDAIAADLDGICARIELARSGGHEPALGELERERSLRDAFMTQQTVCDSFVPPKQLNTFYTDLGGTSVNAFTGRDLTHYRVNLPANKIELFFLIESQRMSRCAFREFYKEKEVVIEERRRAIAQNRRRVIEQSEALIWEATPYRNPNLGWPEDVRAISRPAMIEYYRTWYVPNNATVVLAGNIDPAAALELARKYFGAVPRGCAPPRIYTRETTPPGAKDLVIRGSDRPFIQVIYRSVAAHHASVEAFEVLAGWLGSTAGPLHRILVEEAHMLLAVEVVHMPAKLAGEFLIGVRLADPAQGDMIVDRIQDIVGRCLAGEEGYAIPAEQAQAWAARTERELATQLGQSDSATELMAESAYVGSIARVLARPERARALTPARITELCRGAFILNNRVTVRVMPPETAGARSAEIAVIAELVRQVSAETNERRRKELERILKERRAALAAKE